MLQLKISWPGVYFGLIVVITVSGLSAVLWGAPLPGWVKIKDVKVTNPSTSTSTSTSNYVDLDRAVKLQWWNDGQTPTAGITLDRSSVVIRTIVTNTIAAVKAEAAKSGWITTEPEFGDTFVKESAIALMRFNCPTTCSAQIELSGGPSAVIKDPTVVAMLMTKVQDTNAWLFVDQTGPSKSYVSMNHVLASEVTCVSAACSAVVTLESGKTVSIFEKTAVDQVRSLMPEISE
jgi:hypothetical protein